MKATLLSVAALALAVAAAPLAAQEAPLPPDQETEHVVKPGETLGGIASRAEVPRVLIIEANGLKAPYGLRAGQRLVIPRTRHHTIAAGETGFLIAWKYGVPWADIAVANGIEPEARLPVGRRLLIPTVIAARPDIAPAPAPSPSAAASAAPAARFTWPVSGTVRRGFTARGQANYHDGIDIAVPVGTAVRASEAGKVVFAGEEPSQFGNLVIVDHGGGWTSAYAFLSRLTVKEGDAVRKGERVGLSGRTGRARGPELHFEVRRNNRPVDPRAQLPSGN